MIAVIDKLLVSKIPIVIVLMNRRKRNNENRRACIYSVINNRQKLKYYIVAPSVEVVTTWHPDPWALK